MTKENALYEIALSHQQLLHVENALKQHHNALSVEWFDGEQDYVPEEICIISDMKNVVTSALSGESFNASQSKTESLMWIKELKFEDVWIELKGQEIERPSFYGDVWGKNIL